MGGRGRWRARVYDPVGRGDAAIASTDGDAPGAGRAGEGFATAAGEATMELVRIGKDFASQSCPCVVNGPDDLFPRVEDPVVLWERDGSVSQALARAPARYPAPDRQCDPAGSGDRARGRDLGSLSDVVLELERAIHRRRAQLDGEGRRVGRGVRPDGRVAASRAKGRPAP